MEMKAERRNGLWIITALAGRFAGKVIAHAEGIDMTNVMMVGDTMMGKVRAVWGAELLDAITTDPATLKGLGIGRRFGLPYRAKINLGNGGVAKVSARFRNLRMVVAINDDFTYLI